MFRSKGAAALLVLLLFASVFLTASPASIASPGQSNSTKVIYAGRLIDGTGNSVRTNVSIIVEGGRIREVRDGRASVSAAQVIDLSDATVMPGLVDCHTHLTMFIDRESTGPSSALSRRASAAAITATLYAKATLLAGFTTVRDVGASEYVDLSLKEAINAGRIPGPRMFVATRSLSITGGHGDLGGLREDVIQERDWRTGIVNGPEDAVKAVRYATKYGADLIKISATGGVLSLSDASLEQHFSYEEMKAIVDTAHMLGLKVAAHAHGARGIREAVRAGVDSIEHGSYLDSDGIALMKERGTYLVATIIAGKTVEAGAKQGMFPPMIAEKALKAGPLIQNSFGRAYKAGVRIAFGTDAGVFQHGQNAREFEYMVEAGMPAIEAILAATRNAADLLGQSQNIGSVQPVTLRRSGRSER